ncbi:hypothetical protein IPM65_01430 [Candidatus Roizmanbacteria bacterium]|nr:MAG: hypothetical protein IPM65_01430 [Candidatus Roizmanbacteria bacterium]
MEQLRSAERERFISKRVVVKIGSSTITGGLESPDKEFIENIASQISVLKNEGLDIYVVSSGAVACGRSFVQDYDAGNLAHRQIAAAIGQPLLMSYWAQGLSSRNLVPAQILVTDQTLRQAHQLLRQMQPHQVPIINANDAVSDFEMRQWMQISGDNDVLAGQVALETGCDTVYLLTDVSGVLDNQGQLISAIDLQYPLPRIEFNGTSKTGTGGMASKHNVALNLAQQNIRTIIGNGREPNLVINGSKGLTVGTTYLPYLHE